MEKHIFKLLILLIIGCNTSTVERKERTPNEIACAKYNVYYDTLKSYVNDVYNDNDNHHFHFEIDYSGKATFRQANAPKWNWLHSGYVIGNLKALQDTLRKCECMQKKDESFIENALQHVKAEEEKVNTLEKESKINGTDMFMDGVELVSKEIVFNPDM